MNEEIRQAISPEEMRQRIIEAQKSAVAADVPTKAEKLAAKAKNVRDRAEYGAKQAKSKVASGARKASEKAAQAGEKYSAEARKAGERVSTEAKKAGAKVSSGAKKAGERVSSEAKKAGAKVSSGAKKAGEKMSAKAKEISGKYAGKDVKVRSFVDDMKYDVEAIMARDPAARTKAEAVLLYSGFHALAAHRVAHALDKKGAHFTARLISQATKLMTGIEIHPGATIGRGLFIDHGSGVVIGETTIIGDDCTIYQGATLGGTGKETGKRHPTLGDRVMVGAGAKLLGNFTVGSGSKIAAGAVVLRDVPENCTAVGIPAKVVKKDGVRVTDEVDLDQTHIPDPVAIRMDEMQREIEKLEGEIAGLKAPKKRAPKPADKPTAEANDSASEANDIATDATASVTADTASNATEAADE